MEVKKYEKIILDSSRSIDDIVASVKAELSKQESKNAGESYICYVSHAYSSGDNAGANYIVVSDGFKELKTLSSNVIQISPYNKDEINELIATNISTKANANAVVNLTSDQTIEGVKTFSSVPVVATQPTNYNQVVNKAYVDSKSSELNSRIDGVNNSLTNSINAKANSNAVVALSGNQTINGVKTFTSVPIVATQPINNNQVANKAYVDSKSRKVSWGLNWNAGITVNGHTPLVIPNDGVIFLWGGEEFLNIGHPNDTKISAFQFTPKNYTARSGIYSKLFSKSVANGRETITEDPTENSFFLFGLGSGIFTGSPTIYPLTTTLSFLPVRQGDKVFLQYFNRFGRDYYYLFGIFFPFEK